MRYQGVGCFCDQLAVEIDVGKIVKPQNKPDGLFARKSNVRQ